MLILAPEMEGNGILLTNPLAPSKNRTRRGKKCFFLCSTSKEILWVYFPGVYDFLNRTWEPKVPDYSLI